MKNQNNKRKQEMWHSSPGHLWLLFDGQQNGLCVNEDRPAGETRQEQNEDRPLQNDPNSQQVTAPKGLKPDHFLLNFFPLKILVNTCHSWWKMVYDKLRLIPEKLEYHTLLTSQIQ